MSDALALPVRPSLDQYQQLAAAFQQASRTGDPRAVRDWAVEWATNLARRQGRPDTPETQLEIDQDVERIRRTWRNLQTANPQVERATLAGARLLIARCHGFRTWLRFANHLAAMADPHSPVAQFEAAADAIIGGDIATLRTLLLAHPDLPRKRSTREHRSTLLHYVSANGVEDFRQKTPPNIVEIAALLLDAGAAVNAESDAYGGRSTPLGLTATSVHPETAGVQLALMALLIDRGAALDGPDSGSGVNACLRNGRGEAAEYLGHRGARLDLEGAAGIGRLDIVKTFFTRAGRRRRPATRRQWVDAFISACTFGRNAVVEFLLGTGLPVDTKANGGATGLHWAAYEGHADTVQLLLDHAAPVDTPDASYSGTPLDWALYAWGNRHPGRQLRRPYYETVARLVRAGAKLDPEWFADDPDRRRAAETMRADPRMMAALNGDVPQAAARRPAPGPDGARRVIQLQMKTPRDLTCAFSPDRTLLATGVVGRTVRVWNTETGECVHQLAGHTERIWGLAWSRDGERILSGAWDNTARLWDVRTGKCLRVLQGHTGFVRAVEFSADGKRAITAGGDRHDRSVRVWNLETGECLQVLTGHTDGAYCALLAADGDRAVSGSRDGTVRVWDIPTGRCTRIIDAHATHVQHLAWSHDQRRVLSCSIHVRLWDLNTGTCLQSFEGHADTIRTVDWGPGDRHLVSASHDRTVRIWDATSGTCAQVLEGHPTLVVAAAWDPARHRILSCDEDAQLRIWHWNP